MKIEVVRLDKKVDMPTRATDGSAGFDLQASLETAISLAPGEARLIPTGLAIHIDKKKIVGTILPRSKLGAKQGLVIGNLVGVIDSDYTGQWYISAWNRNHSKFIDIQPYEKIAQAVFLRLADVELEEVAELSNPDTERKDGGTSKDVDTGTGAKA